MCRSPRSARDLPGRGQPAAADRDVLHGWSEAERDCHLRWHRRVDRRSGDGGFVPLILPFVFALKIRNRNKDFQGTRCLGSDV